MASMEEYIKKLEAEKAGILYCTSFHGSTFVPFVTWLQQKISSTWDSSVSFLLGSWLLATYKWGIRYQSLSFCHERCSNCIESALDFKSIGSDPKPGWVIELFPLDTELSQCLSEFSFSHLRLWRKLTMWQTGIRSLGEGNIVLVTCSNEKRITCR